MWSKVALFKGDPCEFDVIFHQEITRISLDKKINNGMIITIINGMLSTEKLVN